MFCELIILAFSPDIDYKIFKNMEILQADRRSRNEPHFYALSKKLLRFILMSNNFALTDIEK